MGRLRQIIKGLIIRIQRNFLEFQAMLKLTEYYKKEIDIVVNEPPKEEYCEIVTIAFNNHRLIEYQIKFLNINFVYPFRYTVFDNSSSEEESRSIKELCKKYMVGYAKLPVQKNIVKGMASYSHGIALNYVWENFVSMSNAKYFATIDHDIFPINKFDLREYIESETLFGLILENSKSISVKKSIRYLWPGFSFFDLDYMRGKKIDFRPDWNINADTGAKNYEALYKNLPEESRFSVQRIRFDNELNCFENGYEYFDCGWIHMWNGSNYTNSTNWDNKKNSFFSLLNEKLNNYNF